ncbi:MAG TPA: DUF503 domain-containing protein [Myxococcaceae bacterium]|nr:DUF503 domain-containing protein [Myxococcaceae bacterium]
MFICVSRLTLAIPESGSLKAKRQILRRVTDRLKARFNVAVAEVEDNDLWQKATLALAVVGNERRHVNEQMDKIIHSVEEMYVAPLVSREIEILSFGDQLFAEPPQQDGLPFATGQRSLAEAEGMGVWEERHERKPGSKPELPRKGAKLSLEEARARARGLRNPREWEKK